MKRNIIRLCLILMTTILFNNGAKLVCAEEPTTAMETTVEGTTIKIDSKIKSPSYFRGFSSKKVIKLKWNKVKNATGYILYKNNKKIKKLKGSKTSFADKKVKLNKTYKYRIISIRKASSKTIKSKKSYQIKVRATNSKSKKLNATRITGVKKTYNIGLGESKKLKCTAKFSKKIKGKKAKHKKVVSKKIKWISSNPGLVKIDKKGKITVSSDAKGTAKIYARCHSGVRKVIKINVVDFAEMHNVRKNTKLNDTLKSLMNEHKDATVKIAKYFREKRYNKKITFSYTGKHKEIIDGEKIEYVDILDIEPEIYIEEEMKNELLDYIIKCGGVKIIASKNYVFFEEQRHHLYGIELYDLAFVFNELEGLDNYQYDNAVYNVTSVADRWYYGRSTAYGDVF